MSFSALVMKLKPVRLPTSMLFSIFSTIILKCFYLHSYLISSQFYLSGISAFLLSACSVHSVSFFSCFQHAVAYDVSMLWLRLLFIDYLFFIPIWHSRLTEQAWNVKNQSISRRVYATALFFIKKKCIRLESIAFRSRNNLPGPEGNPQDVNAIRTEKMATASSYSGFSFFLLFVFPLRRHHSCFSTVAMNTQSLSDSFFSLYRRASNRFTPSVTPVPPPPPSLPAPFSNPLAQNH